jgi:hypothetical protein
VVFEGGAEAVALLQRCKTAFGADVARQLAADVVVERLVCQAGEEVARQRRETILGRELSELDPDILGTRAEQARHARANQGRQRLRGGLLGEDAEVRPSRCRDQLARDRGRETGDDVDERGIAALWETQGDQLGGKPIRSGSERQLGQEPDRAGEGGITACGNDLVFSRDGNRVGQFGDVRAVLQEANDFRPLLAGWQNTEAYVAHGLPLCRTVAMFHRHGDCLDYCELTPDRMPLEEFVTFVEEVKQ